MTEAVQSKMKLVGGSTNAAVIGDRRHHPRVTDTRTSSPANVRPGSAAVHSWAGVLPPATAQGGSSSSTQSLLYHIPMDGAPPRHFRMVAPVRVRAVPSERKTETKTLYCAPTSKGFMADEDRSVESIWSSEGGFISSGDVRQFNKLQAARAAAAAAASVQRLPSAASMTPTEASSSPDKNFAASGTRMRTARSRNFSSNTDRVNDGAAWSCPSPAVHGVGCWPGQNVHVSANSCSPTTMSFSVDALVQPAYWGSLQKTQERPDPSSACRPITTYSGDSNPRSPYPTPTSTKISIMVNTAGDHGTKTNECCGPRCPTQESREQQLEQPLPSARRGSNEVRMNEPPYSSSCRLHRKGDDNDQVWRTAVAQDTARRRGGDECQLSRRNVEQHVGTMKDSSCAGQGANKMNDDVALQQFMEAYHNFPKSYLSNPITDDGQTLLRRHGQNVASGDELTIDDRPDETSKLGASPRDQHHETLADVAMSDLSVLLSSVDINTARFRQLLTPRSTNKREDENGNAENREREGELTRRVNTSLRAPTCDPEPDVKISAARTDITQLDALRSTAAKVDDVAGELLQGNIEDTTEIHARPSNERHHPHDVDDRDLITHSRTEGGGGNPVYLSEKDCGSMPMSEKSEPSRSGRSGRESSSRKVRKSARSASRESSKRVSVAEDADCCPSAQDACPPKSRECEAFAAMEELKKNQNTRKCPTPPPPPASSESCEPASTEDDGSSNNNGTTAHGGESRRPLTKAGQMYFKVKSALQQIASLRRQNMYLKEEIDEWNEALKADGWRDMIFIRIKTKNRSSLPCEPPKEVLGADTAPAMGFRTVINKAAIAELDEAIEQKKLTKVVVVSQLESLKKRKDRRDSQFPVLENAYEYYFDAQVNGKRQFKELEEEFKRFEEKLTEAVKKLQKFPKKWEEKKELQHGMELLKDFLRSGCALEPSTLPMLEVLNPVLQDTDLLNLLYKRTQGTDLRKRDMPWSPYDRAPSSKGPFDLAIRNNEEKARVYTFLQREWHRASLGAAFRVTSGLADIRELVKRIRSISGSDCQKRDFKETFPGIDVAGDY